MTSTGPAHRAYQGKVLDLGVVRESTQIGGHDRLWGQSLVFVEI